MSEGVNLTFSATIEDFASKLARMEQLNEKLITQNRKLRTENEEAGNAASNWAGSQLTSLKSMALGYLSVEGAIRAVGDAYAYNAEQARKSKDVSVTIGDAQAGVIRNLGKVTLDEQRNFLRRVAELSESTPVKGGQATYLNMAAAGLSASAGNQEATLAAMQTAAQLAPESAESATQISGALLGMWKATGTADAKKNAGLLIQLGQQARVTDLGEVAKNLVPAVIGLGQYGGTAQENAAIVAAITQGSEDPSGRRSGNAAIRTAEQLQKLLPKEDLYEWKDGKRTLAAKGTGLTSTLERIKYLQSHPEDAEKMVGGLGEKLSLEAKQQAAVLQLVTGRQAEGAPATGMDTMTGRFLKGGLEAIPSVDKAGVFTEDLLTRMNTGFETGASRVTRMQAASEESMRQSALGKEMAIKGLLSGESLSGQLEASGAGWWERKSSVNRLALAKMFGADPEEAYKEEIRKRVFRLRTGRDEGDTSLAAQFSQPTPASLQQANILEETAKATLEEIRKMREETAATRIELTKKPSPVAIQNNVSNQKEPAMSPAF